MSSRALIACLLALLTGCDRTPSPPGQAAGATPDEVTAAPVRTEKLDRSHKGEAAPAVSFEGPDGKPVTLASFRGKPVLLNLWATWCAPCVAEMPTLDRAATTLGDTVTVVAASQDLDGAAKVKPYWAKAGFKTLRPSLDPKLGLSLAYQANLPTTILLDSSGHEVWRMAGGYAWDTPAAAKLIAEAS